MTPDGQNISVTAFNATVDQYGGWVQLSDMLDLTAVDNVILQTTKLIASQAGRTLDSLTRDTVTAGTNVMFAPKQTAEGEVEVTSREELDATCLITPQLIFDAVALLRAKNAPTIGDSYVGIIHPYVANDLMKHESWLDWHKYASPDHIYHGEIGMLDGVRFVQTSEAKVWRGEKLTSGSRTLTVASVSGGTVTVREPVTPEDAEKLVGRKVNAAGAPCTVTDANAGEAGAATLTLEGASGLSAGAAITPGELNADDMAVFATMILGGNAYGVTEVEGGGLEHIVKQLGYGNDPLNQRASVGWKATHAAKRLVESYMVRIESASGGSFKAEGN